MGTIYNTSMKRTTQDDKTEKVGITLPNSLVKQTDKARGDIPRSTFIRRALEQYIQGKDGK
jgi:metal-responsive CopG/Arc/MetJ family transcriptional regulator